MIRIILGFVLSLLFAIALMLFVIRLALKWKVGQPILHYVESHSVKSGTPTMGGMGIILAAAIPFALLFRDSGSTALVALIVTCGYAIIGFTDDFIKVHFHRNEGLSPRWKIFLQLLVAIAVSLYAYFGAEIGSKIYIPFVNTSIDLGWFAIAFYLFIFVAFTNAVNLTDGLDGLAGGVTFVWLIGFGLIVLIVAAFNPNAEQLNELLLIACFAGAMLGFLGFNKYPAKIFMGDTGSLSIGGLLASLAVLTGHSLIAAILGIMYVVTALSVIVQVVSYKLTKKRVFLMAPLHHHFEKKGVHENHIVAAYVIITTLVVGICTVLTLILTV